ncbi:hypothetical protein, partial [Streptomyces sp. NPDC088789]|uniref:hypothetical protein n=1 Tax=Streptomyces sp. NPDC088789 TaxID=3365899 RepID=UPI003830510B
MAGRDTRVRPDVEGPAPLRGAGPSRVLTAPAATVRAALLPACLPAGLRSRPPAVPLGCALARPPYRWAALSPARRTA